MIHLTSLSKRYGDKVGVDDLTFTVEPGVVTGFLGPNGSGKSTTMRMILGLDSPTSGLVTVNGKLYAEHTRLLGEVGALLEARAVHTGRSARNHLRTMAATAGLGHRRVEDVIDLVGLGDVAGQRVGSFSLGTGQRLGIAAVLLGDPRTPILDEPVNGLDPDGIRWIRNLLKSLADERRTVFLSSHLMSEMALTADHVIVIGKGRLLRDQSMSDFIADASNDLVRVRSPRANELAVILTARGASVSSPGLGTLDVEGRTMEQIGGAAAAAGIVLHELSTQTASLEEAYMAMSADSLDYVSARERAHAAADRASA